MIVQDVLDIYQAEENYIENSMINKSFNDGGCTYKWLSKNKNTSAFRREVFIATSDIPNDLEDRTVLSYVEVGAAV